MHSEGCLWEPLGRWLAGRCQPQALIWLLGPDLCRYDATGFAQKSQPERLFRKPELYGNSIRVVFFIIIITLFYSAFHFFE